MIEYKKEGLANSRLVYYSWFKIKLFQIIIVKYLIVKLGEFIELKPIGRGLFSTYPRVSYPLQISA